ncbi:DUF427 domain-containing protein [Salinisphaera hydrothermalis]|uniref:DUF427 domain-containing protein n=1 Tax=Salinisphaera hydrothermalis (strain C41B8) TaxID=1304275 RepID=A0A084IKA2_SALHC|nr:DUF427 domain-containing protein [Salinisphaera hydrothermalis]KEZ77136.1 hypothetical protein C41B8_11123 [Salinisphaera hydrothermalis C41B8]
MSAQDTEPRITTQAVSETVSVSADTRLIANTRRAVLLNERGYRPKLYVPRGDVAAGALIESDTRTHCPYKGDARYFHVVAGDRTYTDAAWSYDEPLADVATIAGLIAFDHPAIRVDQQR